MINSLKENYRKLINHLASGGYCKAYVDRIEKEIHVILHMRKCGTWVSYNDRFEQYRDGEHSSSYVNSRKSILSVIARFETQGILPGDTLDVGKFRRSYFRDNPLKSLSSEFLDIIKNQMAKDEAKGLKKSSRVLSFRCISSFFLFMQEKGITRLCEIDERHVQDYFHGKDYHRGYTYKRLIQNALMSYEDRCPKVNDVIICIPEISYTRKTIQYLTDEEVTRIKQVLKDKNSMLSYRERAIGIILLYLGLRSNDIANIRMEDINIKEKVITIRQQKTGVEFTLPLISTVWDAIYDYVEKERPHIKGGYLFPSKRCIDKAINKGTISQAIANKIFDVACVRMNKGDRRGSHIFRHHVATRLLGNNVNQPIITSILGHVSPSSTEAYLSADFVHLKECAIDISMFPVKEEVFNV